METIKMEVHTNNSPDLVEVKNEIDIKEDDSSNWKMWCRLCAKDGHNNICIYDTQSPDSHPDIVLAIETHFSSHIRIEEQHLPKSVCSECYYFLKELLSFEKRIDEAQELFTSMMPFKNTNVPSKNEMLDERFISEQTLHRLPDLNCQDMFEINGRNFERNPLEIVDNEAEMKSLEINNLRNNPEEILKEIEDSNCSDTISESDQSDSEQSNDPSTFRKVKTRIRKKYECSECSRKFSNDFDYKLHLKHVHNVDIQLAEHKCDQCSKVFNRKAGLKSHINSIHIKVRPFLCDECGRAFGTLANLNEHKLTHSDYAPYVCNFCSKGFKAQKWLKKHMDMHDPNGHICTICNAHLKSNLTLKRHMVIHSNEKPFKCDVCGYSCKRAKSLKVHLISHAGLKPYACDICFRSFSSGANCLNHKKKSHPDEMAAQEQTGAQKYAQNVPNLAFLKALAQSSKVLKPIVSRRSILNNDAKKS